MSGEIQTRRTPGGLKQKRNTRNEKKRQEQLLLDNPVTSTASTEHFDNFESKNRKVKKPKSSDTAGGGGLGAAASTGKHRQFYYQASENENDQVYDDDDILRPSPNKSLTSSATPLSWLSACTRVFSLLFVGAAIGMASLYLYNPGEFWATVDKVDHHFQPLGANMLWPNFQGLQPLHWNSYPKIIGIAELADVSAEILASGKETWQDLVVTPLLASKEAVIAWLDKVTKASDASQKATQQDQEGQDEEAIPDNSDQQEDVGVGAGNGWYCGGDGPCQQPPVQTDPEGDSIEPSPSFSPPPAVNEDSDIIKMSEPVYEPESEIKPEHLSNPEPELESIVDLEVIPRPWDSPATVNEDSIIIKISEPASDTIPEPDLEVNLEPVSDPEPEIESMPVPILVSEPELEVKAEPVSDPEPESMPVPTLFSDPEPEVRPQPELVSKPESEVKSETVSDPDPKLESINVPMTISEPISEPETEVNPEPIFDPKPELESMPGPVSDSDPEIKHEPELDSTIAPNPVSEPISEFKPEPISHPEPELESTNVPTPVSEPLFVEKTIATLGLEDKVSDDVIANANKK